MVRLYSAVATFPRHKNPVHLLVSRYGVPAPVTSSLGMAAIMVHAYLRERITNHYRKGHTDTARLIECLHYDSQAAGNDWAFRDYLDHSEGMVRRLIKLVCEEEETAERERKRAERAAAVVKAATADPFTLLDDLLSDYTFNPWQGGVIK